MAIAQEPDGTVEDQAYVLPFSDADREQLVDRAAYVTQLMDLATDVSGRTSACGSLGPREVLAALRALEVARRCVEKASTDLLAAYGRMGDSSAHGYRTTAGLLAGEFRITTGEAKRRLHLSAQLTDRISESGEELDPVRPEIAREFADGRISAEEARSLCDAVESLPPSMAGAYQDRVEKTLVELAPTVRLKDIPALCNRIIQHADPDGALPVFEPEPHKYNVTLAQQRNGDWRLRGLLSGQTGTTLHALLYGRMKDTDVPVTVKPHAGHQAAAEKATAEAATADGAGPVAETATAETATAEAATADSACQDTAAADTTGADSAGDEYTGTASADAEIPRIPLEAVWESTFVRVFADGRVDIEGSTWTLDEDEPPFVIGPDGWPRALPERIHAEVQSLLAEVRAGDQNVAQSLVWAKIPGRLPAGSSDLPDVHPDSRTGESEASTCHSEQPAVHSPVDPFVAVDAGDTYASDPWPRGGLAPSGVQEDGQRSDVLVPDAAANAPGIERHDRFGFLLRCVARERVLHGADHALVISARPDDLTRPHRMLSTHTGTPVSLFSTEAWSNAAQTFLHLVDGGGRTLQIKSQGRFATRTQMAVLAARDQGCTFPDCDAPAEWCEANHIVPWALGGETTVDNLALLCPFHHRWFEGSGWTSIFRNGLPAWTPPAHVDRRRRPLFHARFRVALLNLQPQLWTEEE